jgi:hypothetical protein
MNNNVTARYFTRRDITLISEMESKVVSVVVQWAVDGDVKWTRLWRYRSGDCRKTLLTMICHIPLPLKPFLPQVPSEILSFQGYSLKSQGHWNTACVFENFLVGQQLHPNVLNYCHIAQSTYFV